MLVGDAFDLLQGICQRANAAQQVLSRVEVSKGQRGAAGVTCCKVYKVR